MLQQINYSNYPKTANEENYIPTYALATIELFRKYATSKKSERWQLEEEIIKRFFGLGAKK